MIRPTPTTDWAILLLRSMEGSWLRIFLIWSSRALICSRYSFSVAWFWFWNKASISGSSWSFCSLTETTKAFWCFTSRSLLDNSFFNLTIKGLDRTVGSRESLFSKAYRQRSRESERSFLPLRMPKDLKINNALTSLKAICWLASHSTKALE